jgi:hypothetical protein
LIVFGPYLYNIGGGVIRPQSISSEPSTPEELVAEWERLHHTISILSTIFVLKYYSIEPEIYAGKLNTTDYKSIKLVDPK